MKNRFLLAATLAVAVVSVLGTPAASASTLIGDQCVANEAAPGLGLFEIAAPGNPLPTAAPSSGVITKWAVNLIPAPVTVPTQLKVVRPTGPNQLFIVGESALATVSPGPNSFSTRVPIQAGDRIGLYGPSEIGTLYCETGSEVATFGIFLNAGTGATTPFEQNSGTARVPVTATIEADADNDGFGDESQDGCPQSAAVQTACPVVTLDTISQVGRRQVTVFVATSASAPVAVTGTVNLGKGKKAKLKSPAQTVPPGKLVRFKLKFNAKLIARLKELPASKKLTLKITASATNVAGQVSTDKAKATLKGQA